MTQCAVTPGHLPPASHLDPVIRTEDLLQTVLLDVLVRDLRAMNDAENRLVVQLHNDARGLQALDSALDNIANLKKCAGDCTSPL